MRCQGPSYYNQLTEHHHYSPYHLPLEPPADPGQHLLLLLVGEGGGVEHVPAEVLLGHVLLHAAVPTHTTTIVSLCSFSIIQIFLVALEQPPFNREHCQIISNYFWSSRPVPL